jgi:hypothetical protein
VRGDVCWYWWNCWPSFNPISTKITSHFSSLSDGQQFHQYQQKSPLTSTHSVMVNNSTNIHSMSWCERWFLLILVELLTITQWVEVRGDFCWYNINQNHISLQLIEWWSTIPPISKTITPHLNSLNDGQQFHRYWWNCWPSFNELRWEVIFIDIGGIVDHHSMSWGEWSLRDGKQFHQYQQKSPLTSTHWVMSTIPLISTKITSHFNSLWFVLILVDCWPSLNELRWEVIFIDIGGIVYHHSMS